MDLQSMIDKYTTVQINSLKIENGLSNIEKNIILKEESQKPKLVELSDSPIVKDNCFYELPPTNSITENFPKTKYTLKPEKRRTIDLDTNSIFSDDNYILNMKEKEKIKNKITEIIKNNKNREFIPKLKVDLTLAQSFEMEKNNRWYIMDNKQKLGPFNDYLLYKKITEIYGDCISKNKKIPNYLIKSDKNETYLTMEKCLQKFNKEFYQKIMEHFKKIGLIENWIYYLYPNLYNFYSNNNNIEQNNNNAPGNNDININTQNHLEEKEINVNQFFNK